MDQKLIDQAAIHQCDTMLARRGPRIAKTYGLDLSMISRLRMSVDSVIQIPHSAHP